MSEETKVQEDPREELKKFLETQPGMPSVDLREQWKAQYGEIFCSAFSETELFIFRPLMRKEHRELQSVAANPDNKVDQFGYEEMLCATCVLYPTGLDWATMKGGTASTLSEQIMSNSNFMNPQAASMLVFKL
jgi:hypothetical protein